MGQIYESLNNLARQGKVRFGEARQGGVWFGVAGGVGYGKVWSGRYGEVWRGKVR
jgi:hypothetical protein